MPPKKAVGLPPVAAAASDEQSIVSADGGAADGKGKKRQSDVNQGEASLSIEEFMMPRMMSVRLAKGVLPPQTLIHKDAATAMQYATSIFLNHIAHNANEHTINSGRKNISPADILEGIKDAEWAFLVPQLEEELNIYVRTVNDKRNEYRRRLKERDSGIGVELGQGAGEDNEEGMDEGEDGPKAKRARLSDGVSLEASQMDDDLLKDDAMDDQTRQSDNEEDVEDDPDEDEAEDDDEEEQYGSAAEDLPVEDIDDDGARDGDDGEDSENESD